MATADITKVEIKRRLRLRNIDVLLLCMLCAGFYLLSKGAEILVPFVFYMFMMLGVYIHTVSKQYVIGQKRFLVDLLDYDLNDIWSPLLLWGIGFWLVLLCFFATLGTVTFPEMDIIVFQIVLVVPCETFIFCVFLPEVLGKFLGIPGWFWGAGIFFATFHFWSYGAVLSWAMLGSMLIAGIAGLCFYGLYKLGDKNKRIGGIMATMSVHFVLNFWIISTGTII